MFLYKLKRLYTQGAFPVFVYYDILSPSLPEHKDNLFLKNGGEALRSPGDCYGIIIVLHVDPHCAAVVMGNRCGGLIRIDLVMTGWGIFLIFLK